MPFYSVCIPDALPYFYPSSVRASDSYSHPQNARAQIVFASTILEALKSPSTLLFDARNGRISSSASFFIFFFFGPSALNIVILSVEDPGQGKIIPSLVNLFAE